MSDAGYAPLVSWVEGHVQAVHRPPRRVAHLVTAGSTNGVDLAVRCLADRGDAVVVEEHTYSATLQAMRPLGLHILSVPTDSEGPVPAALRGVCEARRAAGAPQIRFFYAVPVSGNPTGITWSPERYAAVYSLACEFDFALIEDDAYYYLQFERGGGPQRGLKRLSPSLLSMDTQSRVIRLDACSKFLAPGLRLGWATAPPAVMARMTRCMQSTVQGAACLSQILAHKLLSGWGEVGLDSHLLALQAGYARRCDALLAAAERHLGGASRVATWHAPRAGMFLWITLSPCVGVADAEALQPHLVKYQVAVVPGRAFRADPGSPSVCMRLSFASASDEDFERGMARLSTLLRARAEEARGCATPVGVW